MQKFIILIATIFTFQVSADTATEPTAAAKPLYEQVENLDYVSRYVERTDLSRLLVIQKNIQLVIEDMANNLKAGKQEVTMPTLRLIQNVIIQYRFSQVFFGWSVPRSITSIYTIQTSAALDKLKMLSEKLVSDYGYDDSPYTQITANTFRQMQKLLKQLESTPLDADMQKTLRDLWMPIGEVIAVAEQGDRPNTFAKAIPLIAEIRKLYPQFDKISSSAAGFAQIMELQGLTEFYAEFAQVSP